MIIFENNCIYLENLESNKKKMVLRYILLVNKQGQTRLSQYYTYIPVEERVSMEGEIIRKCLSRSENQVNLIIKNNKIKASFEKRNILSKKKFY